jgi:hypothetical protein
MSDRPSGTICTPDEQALSSTVDSTLRCFDRQESLGLLTTTEASVVSLIAVSYVFSIILWNIGRLYFDPERRGRGLRLFRQPMDLLMLSLFIADALQATGGVLNAKWVNDGKIEVGTLCNVQGIIQNVGETAVALSNLTISVYTLLGLWLRKDIASKRLTLVVIACIWTFIAIIVAVGNATNHDPVFESPTPYWCWIGQRYMVWRIVAEYMWFWLALLLSLVVYIPLLWLQDISRARWRQALIFLAYPLAYCISVLPLSITRWIGFVQEAKYGSASTPPAAIFACISLFALSGFFNVILLLNTKPNCGLFGNLASVRRPPEPVLQAEAGQNQANVEMDEEKEDSSEGIGRLP